MRDSEPSPVPPADDPGIAPVPADDRSFFVINLCASPVQLPLEMPTVTGLNGLVVFRSHQVHDGRHRYRLHLGYFETRDAAERALPMVQPRYPTAWIAVAPAAGLGSLDDTGDTDFRLIQAPPTIEELEDSTKEATLATEIEAQRYAVQLTWSAERIDPTDLPPIAIFDAYTLYTVTCSRGGVRFYGVRLGFFKSAISASQVAAYIRPDFSTVAVVPVSDREFAYASWMVRHRNKTVPAAPETRTPTQVEIAQIRSPEEVSLALAEPVRPTLPEPVVLASVETPTELQPPPLAPPSPPRLPDVARAARIAALEAHEIHLSAQFDPPDERETPMADLRPFRSEPFPRRRSALSRLLERLTDRLG